MSSSGLSRHVSVREPAGLTEKPSVADDPLESDHPENSISPLAQESSHGASDSKITPDGFPINIARLEVMLL